VIGVDSSAKMLEQAQSKIEASRLKNLELQFADAEALNFPSHYEEYSLMLVLT
jgi:ubiquinone/menaquinone biosynthesis C-methylase UbiE